MVKLPDDVEQRLDHVSRRLGVSASTLAQSLLLPYLDQFDRGGDDLELKRPDPVKPFFGIAHLEEPRGS